MSLGEDREEVAARHAGRSPRTMLGLSPGKSVRLLALFVILGAVLILTAIITIRQPGDNTERPTTTETATGMAPQEPPRKHEVTVTEVAPGVYHLEFGGNTCDEAPCLKRALALVLEQTPGRRIVSVAPIGVYGSPFAFAVVTTPQ